MVTTKIIVYLICVCCALTAMRLRRLIEVKTELRTNCSALNSKAPYEMETELFHLKIMVPRAGIEPARCCHRGIFLPTTAFAAALKKHLWSGLSLHHICNWIAVVNLDGCRQVSTRSTDFSGLRSGLPSPLRVKVSPNLTPFTPVVS